MLLGKLILLILSSYMTFTSNLLRLGYYLVIKQLLFPTTSGVDTEITKKEIKKADILQNLSLP